MRRKTKRTLLLALAVCFLTLAGGGYVYVRSYPLVFNESFIQHAHCMAACVIALHGYASDHGGHFPSSPKGYADALAMTDSGTWILTGPGYTARLPEGAKQGDIPEDLCGRVYVQGLKASDDFDIAILFDKKATPGGDHCHFPRRLWAPLGREVMFVGGSKRFISQSQWEDFASQQIEKLAAAGIPYDKAQWHYGQVDK